MSGPSEIELKFQLPGPRVAALARALGTARARQVHLQALYFDTADGRLAAAAMALRLRHEGDHWVQTLKGRGDGLLHRLEHEVRLSGRDSPGGPGDPGGLPPALDLRRHDGTEAGRRLRQLCADGAALRLQYRTDIQRLLRVVRSGGAQVEVALDRGHILAGSARLPVCEVEFELLDGPLPALLALAARWAARHGLVLDSTTKSERGQRLAAGLAVAPVQGPAPAGGAQPDRAGTRAQRIGAALRQALPNAAAIQHGMACEAHVQALGAALGDLMALLQPVPAGPAQDGLSPLRPLWSVWRLCQAVPPSLPAVAAALNQAAVTRAWLDLMAQSQAAG